jgi:hypothetical protein
LGPDTALQESDLGRTDKVPLRHAPLAPSFVTVFPDVMVTA